MDTASSGSRVSVLRFRPAPKPGRAWPSSGRANTSTYTGRSRTQSVRWSRKSSSPVSAYWASSTSSTTGFSAASRSKNSRHPANSSSRDNAAPPSPSAATPSSRPSRTATYPRSPGSATYRARPSASLPAAVSGGSSSAIPSRCRTISASAQNATPSPYDRHRPRCHHMSSTSPSAYFSNSQPSRDLPTPAGPDTSTSRGARRSAAAWNRSLTVRSSTSRPVSGASSPSTRCTPPTADTTRVARHSRAGSALPFSACSLASANPIALPARRCVAASVSTCPGCAADWTRAAVLTASPATMPSPTAPTVTATSPVTTPARAASPGTPASWPSSATAVTRSSAARTARSASPSVAVGVPQTAITASPMNFSTTPPYRPTTVRATAKYSDSSSRTASGSRDSDSGVNPTTSQNSTEHTRRSATGPAPGLGSGPAADGTAGAGPAPASTDPQERQNGLPGETGSPHDGHRPNGAPQSSQNRSLSPRDAPHRGHVTTNQLYAPPGASSYNNARQPERADEMPVRPRSAEGFLLAEVAFGVVGGLVVGRCPPEVAFGVVGGVIDGDVGGLVLLGHGMAPLFGPVFGRSSCG